MIYYQLKQGISAEDLIGAGFTKGIGEDETYVKIIPLGAKKFKINAHLTVRRARHGGFEFRDEPRGKRFAIWDDLQNREYIPAYCAKPNGSVAQIVNEYGREMDRLNIFERR